MTKAQTGLGRRQGGFVLALDDMSLMVKNGAAFSLKADSKRPAIFRILPEVEEDGSIQPMRYPDGDLSAFYTRVTLADWRNNRVEKGGFKTVLATPREADVDTSPKEYPLVKLYWFIRNAVDSGDDWALRLQALFVQRGNYDQPDLPKPTDFRVVQAITYKQPGCSKPKDDVKKLLTAHPVHGNVLKDPTHKFVFFKGTAIDAMNTMFMGQDDDGNYLCPADVLSPGSGVAVATSAAKRVLENGNEIAVLQVNPIDLKEAGFPIPNQATIRNSWRPWSAVFDFPAATTQLGQFVEFFSRGSLVPKNVLLEAIDRCFEGQYHIGGSSSQGGQGGQGSQGAQVDQDDQGDQDQDDQGDQDSQDTAQAPKSSSGGWNTRVAEEDMAEMGTSGPISDATDPELSSPSEAMTPTDMEARFNKYRNRNKSAGDTPEGGGQ